MIPFPRLKDCPWYKFNTEEVQKHFDRKNLKYVNTFTLGNYLPLSVYVEPETKLYLVLQQKNSPDVSKAYFHWYKEAEMAPWREQTGIRCTKCGDVIYSRYRHDMRPCMCDAVFVDGGRDYLRISGTDFHLVKIDLIDNTYEIIKEPEQEVKPEIEAYVVTVVGKLDFRIAAKSSDEASELVNQKLDLILGKEVTPQYAEFQVKEVCLAK